MKNTQQKLTKGVILAGGLGTRFLPGTLVVAKELFPVLGKPVLMYHLKDLADAGITDVLIVGNKLKEKSFMDFLNPPQEYLNKLEKDGKLDLLSSYNELLSRFNSVTYVNQEIGSDEFNLVNGGKEEVRGSSVAILAAREWANGEPFVVLNGDDICYYFGGKSSAADIVSLYNKTGDYIIYGRKVDRSLIYQYSSMELGEKLESNAYKMKDVVEKPPKGTEKSDIMGFSRYVFTEDVFDRILKSSPNSKGEYCITDIISDVAKTGRVSTFIFEGRYIDCGSYLGFQMFGNYLLCENAENREKLKLEIENLMNIYKNL